MFKTAIKHSNNFYNTILCYIATGLWKSNLKFSKEDLNSDGKAGFKLIKNNIGKSEPIGDVRNELGWCSG